MKLTKDFSAQLTLVSDDFEKNVFVADFTVMYEPESDTLTFTKVRNVLDGVNITKLVQDSYVVEQEKYRTEMYWSYLTANTNKEHA